LKTVEEVITPVQAENSNSQPVQAPAPAPTPVPAPVSAPVQMAPIPAPTAPSDAAPQTIALGQTKAQVTATFGQPTRTAKLGTKEIYYYKDMKVTFTNGKVSNVE
jgi:3-oxoacyl-ACP reductase-like protein